MPEQNSQTKQASDILMKNGGPGGMGRGSMMGGERTKDFSQALRRLAHYSRRYIPAVIIAVILALAGSILNIIGPPILADITTLITEGIRGKIELSAIVHLAVILAAMYGAGFLFNIVQGIMMSTVTQYITKNMRTDISHKINSLPLRYFDRTSHGDVLSRVTNDVDTIGQSLNQSLGTLVTSVTMLVGTLVMMFWTNAIMAVAGVGSALLGFVLMMVIISRSQKYFSRQQMSLGALNGHIEEIYSGHVVVKAYNGERAATETFDKMNEELYNSAWKSQFFSGVNMPLMMFVGNFSYLAVCVAGALLVRNGGAAIATIVAFMLYVRLFTQPLSQVAQAATSLQSAAAACERVFEFLDEPEMPAEPTQMAALEEVRGNVDFDRVSFGYTPEKTVIHGFSAHIKAGQKVAIVGPTGAGKTTLVNLLMRFYELDRGEIYLDGTPISSLKRANVHDLFGMVLQDTWLFQGTIRENIVYNKEGVSDEQVVNACKAVGLHHFIMTLPNGYDTVLDDNSSLSAGQRQLVTIARAMIKDAPLLILDEATSSVDTRTEVLIQRAMDRLTQGRTAFVIAHRLSTIRNADLILVMKDGDIIEGGTHDELMKKHGFYAALYNSQFQKAS